MRSAPSGGCYAPFASAAAVCSGAGVLSIHDSASAARRDSPLTNASASRGDICSKTRLSSSFRWDWIWKATASASGVSRTTTCRRSSGDRSSDHPVARLQARHALGGRGTGDAQAPRQLPHTHGPVLVEVNEHPYVAQRQRLGPLGGLAQRHGPEQPAPDRGQGLQGLAHLVIDCGFGFQSARHGASVGDGLGRVKAASVVRPRALEVVSAQERPAPEPVGEGRAGRFLPEGWDVRANAQSRALCRAALATALRHAPEGPRPRASRTGGRSWPPSRSRSGAGLAVRGSTR